jgi:hypothetical protein
MMIDTRLKPAVAKEMIKGAPDTLVSEFVHHFNPLPVMGWSLPRLVTGEPGAAEQLPEHQQ